MYSLSLLIDIQRYDDPSAEGVVYRDSKRKKSDKTSAPSIPVNGLSDGTAPDTPIEENDAE